MSNNINTPRLRFPEFSGEWEEKKLGDSFEERTEKNRGDLPLLSLGEAGLVYQSETARKDNSNEDKSKYLRVVPDDIAYNTMRMWQGRCVHAGIEGIVSPAYTVCKPKEGIDSTFHYYLFKSNRMIQKFHQNSQGLVSDTLNLKYEAFSKIKYLLPPSLPEQEKIAECLTAMDNLISAQAQKVDALKEKKKGLMQQLFPQPGQTTPKLRFPGFIGDWEEKKLGEVATSFSGGTPKSGNSDYYGGSIPFIRSGEIYRNKTELFITEEGLKNSSAKLVKKGDLLMAMYGANSGEVAISQIDGAINQAILCIRSNTVSTVFLCNYFEHQKDNITNRFLQGGQGNLSSDIIMSLNIPMSTPDEQQKIAECLSALDEQIAAEAAKLDALKDHKKGLMQQLFPIGK